MLGNDQSGCAQPPATVVANFNPRQAAVDEATHTVYVPVGTARVRSASVEMIDGSTCNGTVNSGCGNTPQQGERRKATPVTCSSIRQPRPCTFENQGS